ncbi:von willebrand factor type A domain protein (macronuclear) [Tetrahymena thermophila SB210]|uniref:von willebrand factor type A domain protein n=1 Tax=Tetrahymena thermophila (strain SB210) TaxID=312017 RepID=Q224C3_TETTS|nr:von willebrand factor type A domain protein [Tetrahymena thermophila SB210]EAR80639.2 von willebrand factor type A domain protein [Tetrahymena thermophila SB210]|eukprot:XP_001028302.2 von willebrand factor type A domain protein [Tetrahymena thermophila SB210]
MVNSVSSIFLLSDGQDDGADIKIKNLLKTTYQQLQEESFTIHSFGFGNDHDGPLMQKIAQIKDGSFYFVEKNDQVDEFFIDALGGLFSVVAQDLTIKIEINRQNELFQKFFKNSYISKTYGHMWKIINQNQELRININQIFSGVSKDFIFELTVPKSEIKDLQDFERNLETINVQLTARPVDSMLQTLKESKLVLTLFTDNEQSKGSLSYRRSHQIC